MVVVRSAGETTTRGTVAIIPTRRFRKINILLLLYKYDVTIRKLPVNRCGKREPGNYCRVFHASRAHVRAYNNNNNNIVTIIVRQREYEVVGGNNSNRFKFSEFFFLHKCARSTFIATGEYYKRILSV